METEGAVCSTPGRLYARPYHTESIYIGMYTYIYVYVYLCVYICIYISICICQSLLVLMVLEGYIEDKQTTWAAVEVALEEFVVVNHNKTLSTTCMYIYCIEKDVEQRE